MEFEGEWLKVFACPLGGVGSGNLSFAGTGQLVAWQIANDFNSGAHGVDGAIVPLTFFAAWAKQGQSAKATLLQTVPAADLPTVKGLKAQNRFPILRVRYETELPIEIDLEAWSPFIPLNAKESATPIAVFSFTLRNPTKYPVEAAVMMNLQNIVGWEGYRPIDGLQHEEFVGNFNTVEQWDAGRGTGDEGIDGWTMLVCQTKEGVGDAFEKPVQLFTPEREAAWLMRLSENLTVRFWDWSRSVQIALPSELQNCSVWLSDLPESFNEQHFAQLLDAVESGANCVLSGSERHPLAVLDTWVKAPTDAAKKLLQRLPLRWRGLRWRKGEPMAAVLDGTQRTLTVQRFWQVDGLRLGASAQVLAQTPDDSPLIVRVPMSKGSLLIVFGSPYEWVQVGQRKGLVGTLIAKAVGIRYEPMTGWRKTAPAFGTMALAVSGDKRGWQITTLPQHEDVQAMWKDFAEDGSFASTQTLHPEPTELGKTCCGAMSAKVALKPNERRSVTFVLAWHFPNRYRTERYGWALPYEYRYRLGNRYNAWFKDARDVVGYFVANCERLYRETKTFADALWDNSLPEAIKDAVASNLAILRGGVLMWLEDGNFYGFEGADSCCPLTCTHVYNYAQSIAFLFPELERTMRWVEWKVQQHPEKGYIPHRVIVPLDLPRLWERGIGGPHNPALDGMLGAVLKTYREFCLSGDVNWLADMFPHVAKLMRHIFERFDPDGDGVIDGEQPNTYDIHTFGSNTFIGTLYLAALKAVEQMAKAIGARGAGRGTGEWEALAEECRKRFELGRKGYVERCWNGEFFINAYDAPNVPLEVYEQNNCWGIGCHSDQLLGQWWAFILDLGYLLPEETVKTALWSIFRYNWRKSLRGFKHSQRVFAEGDESGLIVCTWPNGGRPQRPILYCDEVWTGHEYEVAALLLWNGMADEASKIVEGARNRYRGNKRNPFAEIECGHYYIRALSSWSLLLAASGFACDVQSGTLKFAPTLNADDFLAPFSAGVGWGVYRQMKNRRLFSATVHWLGGEFSLRTLRLRVNGRGEVQVTLNGARVKVKGRQVGGEFVVEFVRPLKLQTGNSLKVTFAYGFKNSTGA
ncbi:MAG: hypothetical protein LKKZDAJK_002568 [Candidatus Fervidibacter sp.]